MTKYKIVDESPGGNGTRFTVHQKRSFWSRWEQIAECATEAEAVAEVRLRAIAATYRERTFDETGRETTDYGW